MNKLFKQLSLCSHEAINPTKIFFDKINVPTDDYNAKTFPHD
jgi:hypothetical protein